MSTGTELQLEWENIATTILPAQLGPVLVVAPHQDDESLGCGGTIALLRKEKIDVHIVFVSDGSMSHPNSKKFPSNKLMLLREQEALNALQVLGVPSNCCTFLRLKDGSVATIGQAGFDEAVNLMMSEIIKIKPQTILVPWAQDPHTDHRASWHITHAALQKIDLKIKMLQYFIWLWELAKKEDLPLNNNFKWFKINIADVLELKQQAIHAHVSQVSNLINDDPEGFILSPKILNYFKRDFELFIEQKIKNYGAK